MVKRFLIKVRLIRISPRRIGAPLSSRGLRRRRLVVMGAGIPAVAGLLAGCRVQFVSAPATSTADRPSAYAPATRGADGELHGTHFSVRVPASWAGDSGSAGDTNLELVLKQPPVADANPAILVSAQDAPTALPLEAYADVVRQHELKDKSVKPIGSIESSVLDGRPAQSYALKSANGDMSLNIISIRGGVAYTVQLGAPSPEFDTAKAGPLRSFLTSWHWE
jgi:hypothetical protein